MRRTLTALGGLLLLALSVSAQDADVKLQRDVTFGKGGGEDLQLNLALPAEGKGPYPLIVAVHGGGWRGGKRQDLDPLIRQLAKQGYVAVTVSYRLSPKHQFPAQIEDVKTAVRYLRANAKKYHLAPDRVGAIGFSAGGHLVSLLGAADKEAGLEGQGGHPNQSSRVQAVVSYFGPTDFTTKDWSEKVEDFFLVPFLGGRYEEKKETYRKASPISYVSKDDPPFLFFHGTKDALVNVAQSKKMAAKLRAAGVDAEAVILEGEGHGWGGAKLEQTTKQTLQFFEKQLKKK